MVQNLSEKKSDSKFLNKVECEMKKSNIALGISCLWLGNEEMESKVWQSWKENNRTWRMTVIVNVIAPTAHN